MGVKCTPTQERDGEEKGEGSRPSVKKLGDHSGRFECSAGMVVLAPKWVRLALNGTNPGLFQIRFQCIWRRGAKCTEI